MAHLRAIAFFVGLHYSISDSDVTAFAFPTELPIVICADLSCDLFVNHVVNLLFCVDVSNGFICRAEPAYHGCIAPPFSAEDRNAYFF
jgi:hypothetical protein